MGNEKLAQKIDEEQNEKLMKMIDDEIGALEYSTLIDTSESICFIEFGTLRIDIVEWIPIDFDDRKFSVWYTKDNVLPSTYLIVYTRITDEMQIGYEEAVFEKEPSCFNALSNGDYDGWNACEDQIPQELWDDLLLKFSQSLNQN